jgi:TetR/AcrR family transcriptional repressor of nem operon
MRQTQQDGTDTVNRILDVAEHLVQVRGFNAFSYTDVAGELELTNAALHYHFPSKSDLGEGLLARYSTRFAAALDAIDESMDEPQLKLDAYADLYADVLRNQRMCLCGMLAAEYETLSAGMRLAVTEFFEANETWLAGVLREGRGDGTLSFAGSPLDEARSIVSSLEGAMLVARSFGDIKRFRSAARHLLIALRP